MKKLFCLSWLVLLVLAGCASPPEVREALPPPKAKPPRIALALGGGAAKGFAHVGVIKTLEAHGIAVDMVAGTSAGSVVGVLYAGGYSGYDLQKVALQLEQDSVSDYALPDRGFVKGELLQNYINKALRNRTIDALNKPFAAVATDLQSGEAMVFQRGNTGMAVRASSSVPGVFQPVNIGGRDYVDGGLVSPVPVKAARAMGADIVIAVDISSKPRHAKIKDTLDILLQTFNIMGQGISRFEMAEADVIIQPNLGAIGSTAFEQKHSAIMEGEKAALAALPAIREKIRRFTAR
ncbi:MAG: patatin-like phospholipase family protein [Sulfuricella sp.]|nr:patatin-like phospholipase family protein [Sulfuricella sp.]